MKLRLHKDTAAKLKAVSEWLGMTIGEVARRCLRSWHRAGEPSVDIWLLCDMATDVGSIPYRLRLDRADEVLPAPLLRAVLDWRLAQITVEPAVHVSDGPWRGELHRPGKRYRADELFGHGGAPKSNHNM